MSYKKYNFIIFTLVCNVSSMSAMGPYDPHHGNQNYGNQNYGGAPQGNYVPQQQAPQQQYPNNNAYPQYQQPVGTHNNYYPQGAPVAQQSQGGYQAPQQYPSQHYPPQQYPGYQQPQNYQAQPPQPINIVVQNTANANPVVNQNQSNNQNQNNANTNEGGSDHSSWQKDLFSDDITLADRVEKLKYIIIDGKKYILMDRHLASAIYPKNVMLKKKTEGDSRLRSSTFFGSDYHHSKEETHEYLDKNEDKRTKLTRFMKNIIDIKQKQIEEWNIANYDRQIALMEEWGHISRFWMIVNALLSVFMLIGISYEREEAKQESLISLISRHDSSSKTQEDKTSHTITIFSIVNLLSVLLISFSYPRKSFYAGGLGVIMYWLLSLLPAVVSGTSYYLATKKNEEEGTQQDETQDIRPIAPKVDSKQEGHMALLIFSNILSFIFFMLHYSKLSGIPDEYNRIMRSIRALNIIVNHYNANLKITASYIHNDDVEELQKTYERAYI